MTDETVTNEEIISMSEQRCKVKRCCNSSVKIDDSRILIVAPNIEIRETRPFRQLMEIYKDPMKCLQILISVGLSYVNLMFFEVALAKKREEFGDDEKGWQEFLKKMVKE